MFNLFDVDGEESKSIDDWFGDQDVPEVHSPELSSGTSQAISLMLPCSTS